MTAPLSRRETLWLLAVLVALALAFAAVWLASPPVGHAQEFVPWTTADIYAAIADAAAETGVPESTLVRVVWCESKFDPYAIGRAGERGVAQLHPRGELQRFYAWGFGDPYNPYEAVRFLAQRLAQGSRAWSCR